VGATPPDQRIEVTVQIRARSTPAAQAELLALQERPVSERQYLSREEYEAAHGADPADLEKVEDFAHEHGLEVAEVSPARRLMKLSGTVQDVSAAFGVQLHEYESAGGRYRGRVGAVHVPAELSDIIQGVFGLDDRPQVHPHMRLPEVQPGTVLPRTEPGGFLPTDLAKLYHFPTGLTGHGQCIAIIELGGGYRTADLRAYWGQLHLRPAPKVSAVSVDHGRNRPSTADSADGEVMLDIEVAAGVAPGARIAVYFAPNTDAGFLDAITAAVHDKVRRPSIISISWGGPEQAWTAQAMNAMNEAFQAAAAMGVTVCCASGDDGASDIRPPSPNDGLAHVDFPASSPYVLACGGTHLEGAGTIITREVVWNDGPSGGGTGGGVSDFFDLPAYQAHINAPTSINPNHRQGRGVPDVAGDASPATGYIVRVDGQEFAIGGTSAVAPLWAGLLALCNEGLGKPVGFLNPLLYGKLGPGGALNDITQGTNDTSGHNHGYAARAGWDACTGWGSPDGTKLLQQLKQP
jgi:kumamolisin